MGNYLLRVTVAFESSAASASLLCLWCVCVRQSQRALATELLQGYREAQEGEASGKSSQLDRGLNVIAIRTALRKVCPPSMQPSARALLARLPQPTRADVFTTIYRSAGWGKDLDTVSGPGSTLEQTAVIRKMLPELVMQLGAQSFLDVPCGDLFWMKECELGSLDYVGMDVVPALVAENTKRFGAPHRTFIVGDLVKDDLPCVDVVFCRDCLVHLPFRDALAALRNVRRSGSTYLLATTFTDRTSNRDIQSAGQWRPLNLERGPFCLPTPLHLLNEDCPAADGKYADKSLGLWPISEIPV